MLPLEKLSITIEDADKAVKDIKSFIKVYDKMLAELTRDYNNAVVKGGFEETTKAALSIGTAKRLKDNLYSAGHCLNTIEQGE